MSNFQLPAGFKPSAPPSGGGGGGGNGGGQSSEEQQAAMERAAAQDEMKRGMITAMLEPEARERRTYIGYLQLGHVPTSTVIDRSVSDIPYSTSNGSTSDGTFGQDGSTRTNQRKSHG